jgi:hypothetical protein
MTSESIPLGVAPNLIAVSTGADARWSWQLVTRSGRLLQQSADTFSSLTDALVDGRRHLAAARRDHDREDGHR